MRFLINVPDNLHAALKSESIQRGQTLTGLVRGILWDWLKANVKPERKSPCG